jgi:hypothetical protein
LLLSELTSAARRLALVGLAKNTGKTVALTALLSELRARGRVLGVTSVGHDGEEHDALDARIEKPRVTLAAGSLLATTGGLLRASGLPHEVLQRTGFRTPLGEVLIARLRQAGMIEVAGPGAAHDVRSAADAMLAFGAEQVLIDGAIDRRAASSPDVCDGLVMSTGAVLSSDIEEVVAVTRDAVELTRLPVVDGADGTEAKLVEVAAGLARGAAALVGAEGEVAELPDRFVLTAGAGEIAELLRRHPGGGWLLIAGALPEAFVAELARASRGRTGPELIVADATKVFLAERGLSFYRRQGISIRALHPIALHALTVNPVAPRSHDFDSVRLRELLRAELPDVPRDGRPARGLPASALGRRAAGRTAGALNATRRAPGALRAGRVAWGAPDALSARRAAARGRPGRARPADQNARRRSRCEAPRRGACDGGAGRARARPPGRARAGARGPDPLLCGRW